MRENTNGADWSVLQLEGVAETIHNAARRVAARYQGAAEPDDVAQEIRLYAATHPDVIRGLVGNPAALYRRLADRGADAIRTIAARQSRHVPYEALRGAR